jgi:zinc/manganese transport system permease protein
MAGLALIYRPLVAECLDPGFLRVMGGGAAVHLVFLALVVLNLVGGFQALGTLMVVGLMMLPAAAARFWSESVAGQMLIAVAGGVIASVAGLLVSYHYALPSSPAIILAAGLIYVLSILFGRRGGLLAGALASRRLTY